MTNPHMLAAIAADLDDDTRRLAYADLLDENGDHDRAELIRVQCELAKLPECDRQRCGGEGEKCERCSRYNTIKPREQLLLVAHPEWTQWPCLYCDGTVCGGSGDLFRTRGSDVRESRSLYKQRPVTWDRGWPGWVHVERVSDLVTEHQQRPCGWCHGTGQERIADAAGDMDYATCRECGGEGDVMREYPTPLLSALATTPPWGVPLRGVIVEELRPEKVSGDYWLWREYGQTASLPSAVFNCLKDNPHILGQNGEWYSTEQAAIRAAAAAFLTFGSKHS